MTRHIWHQNLVISYRPTDSGETIPHCFFPFRSTCPRNIAIATFNRAYYGTVNFYILVVSCRPERADREDRTHRGAVGGIHWLARMKDAEYSPPLSVLVTSEIYRLRTIGGLAGLDRRLHVTLLTPPTNRLRRRKEAFVSTSGGLRKGCRTGRTPLYIVAARLCAK